MNLQSSGRSLHVIPPWSKPPASQLDYDKNLQLGLPALVLVPCVPARNIEARVRLLQLKSDPDLPAQTPGSPISLGVVTATTCHSSSLRPHLEPSPPVSTWLTPSPSVFPQMPLSRCSPPCPHLFKIATDTHTSYFLSWISFSPWHLSPPDLIYIEIIYLISCQSPP